jgi:hypothetical protein
MSAIRVIIVFLCFELLMLTALPVPQTDESSIGVANGEKSPIKKREIEPKCSSTGKSVPGQGLGGVLSESDAINAFEIEIIANLTKVAEVYRQRLPVDTKLRFVVEKCISGQQGQEGKAVQCVQKYTEFSIELINGERQSFKVPTKCSLQPR